jgi:hypothetical protein
VKDIEDINNVFKKVKLSKEKGSIKTAFTKLLSSTPTELDFEPSFEKDDTYHYSLNCASESKDTDVDDTPPCPLTWQEELLLIVEEELNIANNNNPLPHDDFRELSPAWRSWSRMQLHQMTRRWWFKPCSNPNSTSSRRTSFRS